MFSNEPVFSLLEGSEKEPHSPVVTENMLEDLNQQIVELHTQNEKYTEALAEIQQEVISLMELTTVLKLQKKYICLT